MKTKHALVCFAALVALAAGQQSSSRHDEPAELVLARVPGKARTRCNPFANDPDAPAAGAKLFEQHCAECHGRRAEGARRGPNLRATVVQEAKPSEIFWIVTNGVVRHGMPAWSKLPEPQRWQIVTWLKSLP